VNAGFHKLLNLNNRHARPPTSQVGKRSVIGNGIVEDVSGSGKSKKLLCWYRVSLSKLAASKVMIGYG
jgi:hypothetical protein